MLPAGHRAATEIIVLRMYLVLLKWFSSSAFLLSRASSLLRLPTKVLGISPLFIPVFRELAQPLRQPLEPLVNGRAGEFLPQPLRVGPQHPPAGLDRAPHQLLYETKWDNPLINHESDGLQCGADQHRRILQFRGYGIVTAFTAFLLEIHDQTQGPREVGALESAHDFHRGRLPPLLTVVPYFVQREDDADDHQQRTENFGKIGHSLQIHVEHAAIWKLVSLHDRPSHTRNAAFQADDVRSADFVAVKTPDSRHSPAVLAGPLWVHSGSSGQYYLKVRFQG